MASGIIPDASQREQILDRFQSLLSEPNVVSLAVRVKPEPTLVVGVISAQGPAPVPPSVTVQVTGPAGRPATVELATKIIAEGEIRAHLAMAAAPGAPGAPAVGRPVPGGLSGPRRWARGPSASISTTTAATAWWAARMS